MIPVYNIYIVKTILCNHKLHILEILACGTKRRLKNGSASLCHYQRNEFYIFEFVAARDKLIFTQRPKRIAAIGGTLSGKT